MAFLSRFTRWHPYMHEVKGMVDGQEVPIPFNLNSIRQVFPESIARRLEEKLIAKFGFNVKVPILELRRSEDDELEFLADYIYHKVFWNIRSNNGTSSPKSLTPR